MKNIFGLLKNRLNILFCLVFIILLFTPVLTANEPVIKPVWTFERNLGVGDKDDSATATPTATETPTPDCVGNIAGQVTDATTGDPIGSARLVYGVGTSRQNFTLIDSTTTNAQGAYAFQNVDCGNYIVVADAIYYSPSIANNVVASVTVVDDQTATADFALTPCTTLTKTPGGDFTVVESRITGVPPNEFDEGKEYDGCKLPPEKVFFLNTDSHATIWFAYKSAEIGDTIEWMWYEPDDSLYVTSSSRIDFINGCQYNSISLQNILLGDWKIEVYRNNVYLFTEYFTITTTVTCTANTESATNITSSSATLNGIVNPNGFYALTVWFEYGTTIYSLTSRTFSQFIDDLDNTLVSDTVNGLSPNMRYYYRIVAQSDMDKSFGKETAFNTLSTPTETPTMTQTPTQEPTPIECNVAIAISASPTSLTIIEGDSDTITVTVMGEDGCLVKNDMVRAIVSDSSLIRISPRWQLTDENGEAVFTIKAKGETGDAVVIFRDGCLTTQVAVKVVN